MNISNNGIKIYLKSDMAKVIAGAFILALVVSTFSYAFADLGAQNIEYTTTESGNPFPNFSIYDVNASGHRNFQWSMNITNNGPGDMHPVVIGFHDDEAGTDPTIEHGFSIDHSGKDDYAEGESGVFNFSFNTNKYNCGRVQIDVGFIDERYPDYHDTNVFAILINYGTDCSSPPPIICSENALVTVTQPLPAVMNAGTTAQFKMKVKNTGNTSWYDGSYYKFVKTTGVNIDPSYGHLPYVMNPDMEAEWTFSVTAPSAPGNYSATMQMLHVAGATYIKPDGNTCPPPALDLYFGNTGTTTFIVPPSGTPALSIEKTVRNVSDNQSNFVESTNADPGETVEFKMQVFNTGSATATSVTVTDTFPAHFTAVGSTTFNLGNIAPGTNKVVTLQAVAGPASEFPNGTSEWINTATASASNHGNVSDTAKVVVTKAIPGQPSLQINKTVKNLSSGSGSYVENVNALPGNEVEFRIEVVNSSGTNATNVTITDSLPNNFSANTALTFNVGTLNAGQNYVTTVRANAAAEQSFPFGASNWVNTASVSASNHSTISDTASVTVHRSGGGGGGGGSTYLYVNKMVRNLTASQTSYYDNVYAQSGDRVMFRITVSNPGSGTANNVRISDSLPFGLNYETNSFSIDGNIYYGNPFNGWISVGNLSTNDTRVITFVAVVNSSGTMTNVATATADNTGTVNDNASVSASQVAGGNINLQFSKKAYNVTKNADAATVVADPRDVIVYTLGVFNSGNTVATNYTIEDDISDILQIASLTDFGGGQFNMGGLSIKWPGLSIPANSKVEKTFSVTVKDSIPTNTDYVMSNTYGNTVNINVRRPQVQGIFVAPKTGNPMTMSLVFAFFTLISFIFYKKGVFGLILKKLKSQ